MRYAVNKNKQLGQGMTEYIIIVALIAVAAIAVTQLFGSTIRSQMAAISQEIAGGDGKAAVTNAQTSADAAKGEGTRVRNLKTYVGNNSDSSGGANAGAGTGAPGG